jgi:hypothetical protein
VLKKLLRDIALFASVGRGTFRSVYDSHIGRGKQPAIARVALARKIAAIILAVWRTGMPFSASLVYTNAKDSGRASEEEFGPERTRAAKAVDLTICRPELTSTGHRRPN